MRRRLISLVLVIMLLICSIVIPAAAEEEPEADSIFLNAADQFVTIQKGDQGNEVENIQKRLIQLGYLVDEADGFFGNNTEKAVMDFQTANSMTADGIASPEMQMILFGEGVLAADGSSFRVYEWIAEPTADAEYIGNKNTHKFHYPYCSSVDQMKDKNKEYLSSRDQAINEGYVPCKKCKP